MKTIKNVIPLVVAVAFFAALNVQAYFDPSVGRFASRDPVNEIGFHLEQTGRQIFNQPDSDSPPVGIDRIEIEIPNEFLIGSGGLNSYCFVSNNSISFFDVLGLNPWCICIAADPDHAWIIATDLATGTTTTYGRWKIGYGHPAASGSGVLSNMEKSRTPVAKRCVTVQTFTPTINAGYDNRNNNCATYADSVWSQVSGESLDDRSSILGVGFDYPPVLIDSITKANGGKAIGPACCPVKPSK